MKGELCPNMTPNHDQFGTMLFEMARMELGFDLHRIGANNTDDQSFIKSFYEFYPGQMVVYKNPLSHHLMAYQPIWKCANVEISTNLKGILPSFGGTITNVDMKDVATINKNQMQQQNNQTMCIVTAVRDPMSHFLSGYNECEHRNSAEYGMRRRPPRKWQWASNSNPWLFTRHSNGTNARFENFVANFIGNPKRVGIVPQATELFHVYSMVGFLSYMNKVGQERNEKEQLKLTGYLPSLDNLTTAFPKFLGETCPNIPRFDYFTKHHEHPSQSDMKGYYTAAKRALKQGGNVTRALCAIHAIDYACFDLIPVPDICKEVFGREAFRERVIYSRR